MFTIRFWVLDFQMTPNLWSKKRTMVDSTIVPGRPRHVGWRRCHTAALWCLIKWLAMDGMMIACDQIFSWKTQTWQTRERATVQHGVCRYWSTSPPHFLGSPEVPRDTKFSPTITWVWLNMEHDMECNQNFKFEKKHDDQPWIWGLPQFPTKPYLYYWLLTCPIKSY